MKNNLSLLGMLLLILTLWVSTGLSTSTEINKKHILSEIDKNLVQANNRLGLKLFRKLAFDEIDDNIFISPFSISSALSMTLNGAKDSTFDSMQKTLEQHELSLEENNNSNQNLLRMLSNLDSTIILEIANSIWFNDTFPVLDKFTGINHAYYNAEVNPLDFGGADACKLINDWVGKKTNGKIKDIVNPPIDPATVMFLINAIYFKADWNFPFEKSKTEIDRFKLPDNTNEQCALMMQNNEFDYYENDFFQAIDLPYGNKQYSMMIFLPKTSNGEDINSLTEKFTHTKWLNWSSRFSNHKVELYMPKFEIEYTVLLNKSLKQLGMSIAFNPKYADFKKMYDTTLCKDNIFIDEVLHKSYIKVDEEGTEAAAVTKVTMKAMTTSFHLPPKKVVMRIDHPFIFVIKDKQSNSILFMGKITNPGLLE
ncbi:MAG: serpin family protein [candidate division Zixibacteria bacterium]|nr:serpin family protein [candidate division Zixibacteria bacterium]